MEKLFFKNSKGNKLSAVVVRPSQNKNNAIVVMAHGFQSNKDSKKFVELERILNENNIATFRFDFYGHGESEGKLEDITMSEAKDDVLSALSYVNALGFAKIFLIGSSFGGLSSNLAASESQNLSGLVLICPVSDYEKVLRESMTEDEIRDWQKIEFTYKTDEKTHEKRKLLWTFFENLAENNGYISAQNITIPTLIVHGDKDTIVPLSQSVVLAKTIKNSTLYVVKNADHFFSDALLFREMIHVVSKFILNLLESK